jgi:hypothetical protein
MGSRNKFFQSHEILPLAGLFVLALAVRLIKISQPYVDSWSWRQTDVAMIAENFYLHGFNILYPQINWAGASPGYVGTEFQLVPFIASLLYIFFGVQDWIGRSVSVLFFAVSVPFFYFLVRKFLNETSSFVAAATYILAPLSIFSSRSFMPDMASLSFSIAGLYFFSESLEHRGDRKPLVAAAVAISLAICVKLPAIMVGLPLTYMAWQQDGAKILFRRDLWAFAVLSLVFPLAWYSHAYFISISHSPHHMFGSGGIAIENLNWYMTIGYQAVTSGLTPILSAAMVIAVFLPPRAKFGRLFHWWLLAILFFMFVAGRGHRHPWYLLPAVAVAAGFVGEGCDALSRARPANSKSVTILAVIFLSYLFYLSLVYIKPLYEPWGMPSFNAGTELNRIAPRHSLVAVADGGDPTCLYYSKRKGWHFLEDFGSPPRDSQQAISELERLKNDGAGYLVFVRDTFWWLDVYKDFERYLSSRYRRVRDTEEYIIFDLTVAKVDSGGAFLTPP